MLEDPYQVPSGSVIETEVLVVGAGPCGITLATEMNRAGLATVLLESGLDRYDDLHQSLSDADFNNESVHAPMRLATRRQLGGASITWGGRCVQFDPIDFEARPWIPDANWPMAWHTVERYHARTCEKMFCGRAAFSSHEISSIRQKSIVPQLPDEAFLSSSLERWSLPTNFWREYRRELGSSRSVRVLSGFTAIEVLFEPDPTVATGVRARSLDGREIRLRARSVVIACGGVESTRLLMASTARHPAGVGNHSGHLGRWYMGHISGRIAQVQFSSDPKQTRHSFDRDEDGTYVRPRFTLSESAQRREKLPNFAAWLVNPEVADPIHGSGILSFAYLALTSPFGKYFASEAIRGALVEGSGDGRRAWRHWANMLLHLPSTARFVGSFGYRRFVPRRRVPGFFVYSPANRYSLHYHCEHLPRWSSRVELSERLDALGMRRVNLHLEFSDADVEGVVRSHRMLDEFLMEHRAGRLHCLYREPEAAVWSQAKDGYHQAGTTRMSRRPEDGVLDAELRVHGIRNLYVASSSAFPSSGQANSTFLAVALTLRLADHLRTTT